MWMNEARALQAPTRHQRHAVGGPCHIEHGAPVPRQPLAQLPPPPHVPQRHGAVERACASSRRGAVHTAAHAASRRPHDENCTLYTARVCARSSAHRCTGPPPESPTSTPARISNVTAGSAHTSNKRQVGGGGRRGGLRRHRVEVQHGGTGAPACGGQPAGGECVPVVGGHVAHRMLSSYTDLRRSRFSRSRCSTASFSFLFSVSTCSTCGRMSCLILLFIHSNSRRVRCVLRPMSGPLLATAKQAVGLVMAGGGKAGHAAARGPARRRARRRRPAGSCAVCKLNVPIKQTKRGSLVVRAVQVACAGVSAHCGARRRTAGSLVLLDRDEQRLEVAGAEAL